MDALDGNAVAGLLHEYFGADMTTARGTCAHCGAPAEIGELAVYMRAPGAVVRCRHCGNVVIVAVAVRNSIEVSMGDFRLVSGYPPAP